MQSYSPYQFSIARMLSGCLILASGLVTFATTADGKGGDWMPLHLASIPAALLLGAGIYRRASALFAIISFPGLVFLIFEAPMIYDGIAAPMVMPILAAFFPFTALMLVMVFASSGEPLRVFSGKRTAAVPGESWTFSPLLAGFALASAMISAGLIIASIASPGPEVPSLVPGAVCFAGSRYFAFFAVGLLAFTGLNLTWLLPPWPQPDPTAKGLPGGQPDYAHPIVFFDGVCNLCNSSVDFLVRADRAKLLRFAPLQGETAARLLSADAVTDMDTMVFRDARGGLHRRSEAILRIGVQMGGLWRVGALGLLIPRGLRDALYKIIARNRYRWFGKKDSCRMPTPAERALFLT